MRTLILLLFVALLPIQAALASFVVHGHKHERMHAPADCDAAASQDGATSDVDPDNADEGGHCHLSSVPLIFAHAATPVSIVSSIPPEALSRTGPSFEPEPLEPVPLSAPQTVPLSPARTTKPSLP